jgi:serine/threonine protein kinase
LGIARYLDNESITRTLFGGPCSSDYAAPEQLRYNKNMIDARTDQFNLGIILVQLLLKGKHPFDCRLVEGNSIPDNILAGNWYKRVFENENLIQIRPFALKLLGYYPYDRYRTPEILLREIESL